MIRYPAVEACLERRYGRGEDQEATGATAVVENLDEPPSLIAGQNPANPIDRNAHGVILAALWFNVRMGWLAGLSMRADTRPQAQAQTFSQ